MIGKEKFLPEGAVVRESAHLRPPGALESGRSLDHEGHGVKEGGQTQTVHSLKP